MKLRVGCSGWSYPEWVGPFYPVRTAPGDYLRLYAKVFGAVEVDSTFYGVPTAATVERWRDATPAGFTFCPKLPQETTGGRRNDPRPPSGAAAEEPAQVLVEFLEVIDRLGDKRGPLVAQYPASFGRREHARDVEGLLEALGRRRSAFEFRHPSWFNHATYRTLQESGAALVWSEAQHVEVPAEVTSKTLMVRFIGDRSFEPRGKVEHPKDAAIGRWAARIETRQEQLDETFVFFNNHFEGFGPGSANRFLARAGAPPVDWQGALGTAKGEQSRLSRFD